MLTDKELEEIRRKLQAVEEEPPVMAWQQIQQQLHPEKRRRPFLWLGPLLLLLLTGSGIWYTQKTKTNTPRNDIFATQPVKSDKVVTAQPNAENSINKQVKPAKNVEIATLRNEEETLPQSYGIKKERKPKATPSESSSSIALRKPGKPFVKANILLTNDSKKDKSLKEGNAELADNAVVKIAKTEVPVSAKENNLAASEENNAAPVTHQDTVPGKEKPGLTSTVQNPDTLDNQQPHNDPKIIIKRRKESFTLGLLFAPRYAFRRVNANTQDEILITDLKESNKLNAARMGYEYGLTYSKSVNRRVYLETGLSLMELKENVAYSFTTGQVNAANQQTSFAPDGSVIVSASYVTEERKLKSSYRYGGLRLGTTYYFASNSQSRFNLSVAAGANLLLKGRTAQYINGVWTETFYFPSKENILEQSNYNLLLGLGYNTHFFRNFEMMVMPTLNYFLGSTYLTREPIGLRPYSVGLTFQIKNIFYKQD